MWFCWDCDGEFETPDLWDEETGIVGECPICKSTDIEKMHKCGFCEEYFQSTKLRDYGRYELCADCVNGVKEFFLQSITDAFDSVDTDSLDFREAYFDIVEETIERMR